MITRADLKVGLQAAQCVHAAFSLSKEYPIETHRWFHGSSTLVLLSVPNEQALLEWVDICYAQHVPYVLIREPDIGNEATALIVPPHERNVMFAELPLMGKEMAMG